MLSGPWRDSGGARSLSWASDGLQRRLQVSGRPFSCRLVCLVMMKLENSGLSEPAVVQAAVWKSRV